MDRIYTYLIDIINFLFPQYKCPECAGKLYKIYQAFNLEVFLSNVGINFLAQIVLIPIFVVLLTKILGEALGIIVFVFSVIAIYQRYPRDRSNVYYGCEACEKETSYPDLHKSKDK